MRSLLCFLIALSAHMTYAQTGPGGVGTNDGTSTLRLWLNTFDLQEHGYTNGDSVDTWADASGYNTNATSTDPNNWPNFSENTLNSLPTIQFDGADEYLAGALSANAVAPVTIFAMGYFNDLNAPAGTGQHLIGLGGVTSLSTVNSQATISRQQSPTVNNTYYSFNGTGRATGPVIAGQQWQCFMASFPSSGAALHQLYINNNLQTVANYSGALNGNANFDVGRNRSNLAATFFNGQVAEIIVYYQTLTTVQRNIVFNYLQAKYGNFTIANDYYTSDAAPDNYDYQVSGVGVESTGSHLTSASAGLTIAATAGFDNGDYLFFGHRVLINSVNDFDIRESSNALAGRWSRVWAVNPTNTGTTQQVSFTFDFSSAGVGGTPANASNYFLVRSLGAGLGWEIVPATVSINGDAVTFSGVSVTANGLYTIASGNLTASPLSTGTVSYGTGPAGVGNTTGNNALLLWLDATQTGLTGGQAVSSWPDLSPFDRDANAVGPDNRPTVLDNQQNGRPVLRFDGVDDYLQGDFTNLDAPFTVFAAGTFALANQGTNNNDYIFDVGEPSNPGSGQYGVRASISRRRTDENAWRGNRYYTYAGNDLHYGPIITGQTMHVYGSVYQQAFPYNQLFYDGVNALMATGDAAVNTNGLYNVGRWSGNSNYLTGDVAEIIVYNTALNTAQCRIIQNYLSAKWGTSLSSDLYTGDDTGRDYDLDVSGIGRAIDGDMALGSSRGLRLTMGDDASTNAYILFGHNNASNSVVSNVSASIHQRMERIWYLTVTGSIGSQVDITFDYSEAGIAGANLGGVTSNFVLLYRAAPTDGWTQLMTADQFSGDQVIFNNRQISASGFYTLGTINGVSLPVQLVSLDAELVTENDAEVVAVRWVTSSEKNNALFVVQRSANVTHWVDLASIEGAGTTTERKAYQYRDRHPLPGTSYYRLKQVDLDGTVSYSHVSSVVRDKSEEFSVDIFPNPATDHIMVVTNGAQQGVVVVLDNLGNEVFNQQITGNETVLPLDLPTGIYHVIIKTRLYTVRRKLSVRH